MADDKKPEGNKNKETSTMTSKNFVAKQAEYKGNSHFDLVEVTITKDAPKYGYKEGQKDVVHPTMALLLKEKGLIDDLGKPYERPKFDQKDVIIDSQ